MRILIGVLAVAMLTTFAPSSVSAVTATTASEPALIIDNDGELVEVLTPVETSYLREEEGNIDLANAVIVVVDKPVDADGKILINRPRLPEIKDKPAITSNRSVIRKPITGNRGLVEVTAYSSTPDQTSGNPFITASGTRVHDGTLAANFLPIGTRVKFPDVYGDKVFTVEDRTAKRLSHRADIWFPSRDQALAFGKRHIRMEIVN